MPAEEYKIERLTQEHYSLLRQLFKNCFGLKLSIEEITQRFNTASLGSEVIGFIAIHAQINSPAAYYGVFPMKAIVSNEVIQIAQSGDTMTDPAHQKKGLFVKLATLTYEECKKKNIQLLIGQPNQNSYHGLVNKLGWSHIDDIVRWDLKQNIKTLPLYKLTKQSAFLSQLYNSYIKRKLKKYLVAEPASFQNSLQVQPGKVWRDDKYLGYKRSGDKFFIKVNQLGLWIRLTDIFWIGDFDDYDKIDEATILKIKKLAWWLGYNTISFNMDRSIQLPAPLRMFKEYSSQASCFLYFNEKYKNLNFILTAADSDTW